MVRGTRPGYRFRRIGLRAAICFMLAGFVVAQADQGGRAAGVAQGLPLAGVASDPATTGQWGALMNWPLVAVHTSLLRTGKILTWDAWETGGTPSVRLWDPATGAFTSVPNQTSQIFCSGLAQLPDGRLMVIGGHNGGEVGITDSNVFDPATNQWSLLSSMNSARWYPSLTELGDGRMAAMSGQTTPGSYADTPELYSPASGGWTSLTGASSSFVHDDGYPLSFLLPNGRLFVFDPEGGHLGILDPTAGTFAAGPISPIRFGAAAMYRPGKILVSGGGAAWSAPTTGATEIIDMTAASPAWQPAAPMAYGRYQHDLVVLADGQVLAVGGSADVDQADLNGPLPTEIWNPQTQTWSAAAALSNPRMYHSTALLLPDGTVLAAGGGRWTTAHDYQTAEIYSPPYLFKGARPTITSAPASAAYGATMTLQTPDAASISSVALVGLGSVTHTLDMDQRYVPLGFTAGSGTLSVQAPADPNLAPPGTYMLFILNGSGVPSIAKFVQIGSVPQSSQPALRTQATTTNGYTVSRPNGVPAGDVMLASLEVDADPVTVTAPAGWTRLVDRIVGAGTTSAFHAQLWSHVAGSSEPSAYTFTPSVGAWVDIGLLDYANVDPTSPVDAVSARDAGVTSTPSTDSVTTTAAGDLVIGLFQNYVNGTWTAGPGLTKRYDFDGNLAEDVIQGAAGPTGARTATSSVAGRTAALIVTLRARSSDTQPPSVSVTSPAAGATVSGSVVGLAASASDNVGVTAVQFSLDGADIGPRLTSAPYSFAWDSTGTPNGTHTISARAWDAAGNVGSAAPVSLTVSNPVPAAPVISNVGVSGLTATGATVTWTTDTPSDSTVEYGTTTAYGQSAASAGLVTSHLQTLSGLSGGTQYHYRVDSKDAYGQVSMSGDGTFTTATAVPAFRSASTATDSRTVSRPSGVVAGDLLLASLEVDADPVTVTGPAGWTLLQDTVAGAGTASAFHAQMWYRVAGSAEPGSYTWSVNQPVWTDVGLVAYKNVNASAPIDVSAGRDAGTTSQPQTSGITTTSANDLVVAMFVNYNFGTWTAGPGMTGRYDFDSNLAEDGLAAAAGPVAPRTATNTTAGPTTAQVVALRAP